MKCRPSEKAMLKLLNIKRVRNSYLTRNMAKGRRQINLLENTTRMTEMAN